MNHNIPILLGTVAAIVITQPAFAKTAREVAQIAVPTTVQINGSLGVDFSGSGVIIARDGNTYTVLTASHVVENQSQDYTIRTSKGNDHPVIPSSIKTFRQDANGLDLAIVQFESSEEYAVAPLSNSDEATIGSGVYISGYPLPALGSSEREYTFTNGQISNIRSGNPRGYNLRYDAVTRRGMSGGPVFDVNGRVIGIHGEGDTVGAVQTEGGTGSEEIKTGINSAIPINIFVAQMSQVGLNLSQLSVDESAPDNVDAEEVAQSDVNGWFEEFAFSVGIGIIRQVLPVPSWLPF